MRETKKENFLTNQTSKAQTLTIDVCMQQAQMGGVAKVGQYKTFLRSSFRLLER